MLICEMHVGRGTIARVHVRGILVIQIVHRPLVVQGDKGNACEKLAI